MHQPDLFPGVTQTFRLVHGDALESLRALDDQSVDSIVTDPPYGLGKEPDALAMLRDWLDTGHHDVKGKGFMGKEWDAFVPQPAVWKECLRVLKPGGHLLAFAGTRTQDLMGLGLRIAGFEVRDCIGWMYGSGFPKSLDVSKAIDKAAGVERTEVVGVRHRNVKPFDDTAGWNPNSTTGDHAYTAPATDDARQWQGFGTSLKPAYEPIIVARKPLIGTVVANVLKHGTGAINVDGCRVPGEPSPSAAMRASGRVPSSCKPGEYGNTIQNRINPERWQMAKPGEQLGRFPANIIHDGSEEVLAVFPDTKSGKPGTMRKGTNEGFAYGAESRPPGTPMTGFGDSGSASRFFYCAKAKKSERRDSKHPTIKPLSLMQYLVRLVTPPGGTLLDPYMGSGTTIEAAKLEGFSAIGIDNSEESVADTKARIKGG